MKEHKISFGKIFWPSFWSAIIVSIIGIIIWIFVLGGLINIFDNSAVFEIKENSVLHMTLQGKIVEKRTDDETLSG